LPASAPTAAPVRSPQRSFERVRTGRAASAERSRRAANITADRARIDSEPTGENGEAGQGGPIRQGLHCGKSQRVAVVGATICALVARSSTTRGRDPRER
jgi:hypothetical protein